MKKGRNCQVKEPSQSFILDIDSRQKNLWTDCRNTNENKRLKFIVVVVAVVK